MRRRGAILPKFGITILKRHISSTSAVVAVARPLPSRTKVTAGLSNALLEAMAAGLPCIANDIPPNREVLDEGAKGVLVAVGDEDHLFEAMHRMINDAAHADAMRAAALSRARSHYGIESVASRYLTLYEDLIKSSVQ